MAHQIEVATVSGISTNEPNNIEAVNDELVR